MSQALGANSQNTEPHQQEVVKADKFYPSLHLTSADFDQTEHSATSDLNTSQSAEQGCIVSTKDSPNTASETDNNPKEASRSKDDGATHVRGELPNVDRPQSTTYASIPHSSDVIVLFLLSELPCLPVSFAVQQIFVGKLREVVFGVTFDCLS